eukprot:709335_1
MLNSMNHNSMMTIDSNTDYNSMATANMNPNNNDMNTYSKHQMSNTNIRCNHLENQSIHQTNKPNMINIPKTFDQRRVVFVSLIGLYQSWKQLPLALLHSSIFILPFKHKWICHPDTCTDELKSSFIYKVCQSATFADIAQTNTLIELIKWKHSQGLVFWMLDEYVRLNNTKIHPFWHFLSNKLSQLTDPMTGKKYNKINLDERYWLNKRDENYTFGTKKTIMEELCSLTMKYNTILEIIHQSNPNTLHPVRTYNKIDTSPMIQISDEDINTRFAFDEDNEMFDNNMEQDIDSDDSESWYISEDYDPYDTA